MGGFRFKSQWEQKNLPIKKKKKRYILQMSKESNSLPKLLRNLEEFTGWFGFWLSFLIVSVLVCWQFLVKIFTCIRIAQML